jgi:hypothetical protein
MMPYSGAYFEKLNSENDLNMTLKGSFEVLVGELDTFGTCYVSWSNKLCLIMPPLINAHKLFGLFFSTVHIWEFDGYKGYDYAASKIRERPVSDLLLFAIPTRVFSSLNSCTGV